MNKWALHQDPRTKTPVYDEQVGTNLEERCLRFCRNMVDVHKV